MVAEISVKSVSHGSDSGPPQVLRMPVRRGYGLISKTSLSFSGSTRINIKYHMSLCKLQSLKNIALTFL